MMDKAKTIEEKALEFCNDVNAKEYKAFIAGTKALEDTQTVKKAQTSYRHEMWFLILTLCITEIVSITLVSAIWGWEIAFILSVVFVIIGIIILIYNIISSKSKSKTKTN
jgi:nitrate reductase NapE component